MFALWLTDMTTTHDEKTIETYVGYSRRFVQFFHNSVDLITRARMGDYQRLRLGEVLRDSLQKEQSALNGFLSWCVDQGALTEEHRPAWPKLHDRALGVRSGHQRAKPVDVTIEEVRAFLEALPLWSRRHLGDRFAIRARFVVAYETGLRPGTIDELEVGIHWAPGWDVLKLQDENDKARYGRTVPITTLCQAALEFVVKEQGLKAGLIFGKHDYRSAVEAARKLAGLPEEFAPYDLRHGRTGHLLDATGDMRAVAFLVGHLRLTTTDKYLRGQERRAIEVIRSFGGQGGDSEVRMLGAKEGSRTHTSSRTLEPESEGSGSILNSYRGVSWHGWPEKGSFGQSIWGSPETPPPDLEEILQRIREES